MARAMRAATHLAEPLRARRLERVVVGHDLKAGGTAAFGSALVLTQQSRASIRLIHIIEPNHRSAYCSCLDKCQCTIEENVAGAGADLEEAIARRTGCGRLIDYEVRVGKAPFELILAACAWHADLIIVGGPDRAAFHLFAGTAERLARKTLIPVLITPRPLTGTPERILIATDFSLAARHAAVAGVRLGKDLDARIFFFHALDPTPWYNYPWDQDTLGLTAIPPLSAKDVESDWASFLSRLRLETVPWQVRTDEGRPAEAILRYAEEIAANLIIMGAKGKCGLEDLFGASVKQAVVRKAATAVLTIGRQSQQFDLPQIVGKRWPPQLIKRLST